MSEPFLGEIRMFGGNFAPRGWALCNGQLLPISQNTALFSILGTTFGGDGMSTFGLPDLQGRLPVHQGQGAGLSPYNLGQNGGEENHTLLINEAPAHNHLVNCSNGTPDAAKPGGEYPGQVTGLGAGGGAYSQTSTGQMNAGMVAAQGGGQPHNNIQPYLCVNFIIALQGIFPSRN